MRLILSFLLIIISFAPMQSFALQESTASPDDPRLKLYFYKPNEFYIYRGYRRYASYIEFEAGESITSISVGDPTGWQLKPSGNRLFIKPTGQEEDTHMTLMTNKRTYFFELYADDADGLRDKSIALRTKFMYPSSQSIVNLDDNMDMGTDNKSSGIHDAIPDIMDNPNAYNFNYTVSGRKEIAPMRIFDDGEFTYMKFAKNNRVLPAIYMVNPDASEALVNFRFHDDYLIIERVSSQYTLRHGKEVACIFNELQPLEKIGVKRRK